MLDTFECYSTVTSDVECVRMCDVRRRSVPRQPPRGSQGGAQERALS